LRELDNTKMLLYKLSVRCLVDKPACVNAAGNTNIINRIGRKSLNLSNATTIKENQFVDAVALTIAVT